jgi:hypothetical protein
MKTKRFNLEQYQQDDPAKHQIIKWFKTWGWKVIVNPDKTGVDLLATNKEGTHYTIEVEVKHNWLTGAFKYETLHIAGRKRKWINETAIHVTINHDLTHFILVTPETWKHAKLITKNTIHTRKETFIEIPIKHCKTYALENKGIYYV